MTDKKTDEHMYIVHTQPFTETTSTTGLHWMKPLIQPLFKKSFKNILTLKSAIFVVEI